MPGQSSRIDDLLASVTADVLAGDPQRFHEESLRIERILLELVRPDPVQARRVLPERIHLAFHDNQLTPTQALRELVHSVQIAARQRGRPFSSVLELLPHADDASEETPEGQLSPEEQLLRDLVNLAVTIRDDGQVNPLTVVDVSRGVTRQYRIETGERRYWASWLLRDFIPAYAGDGMVPCIIVPAGQSSIFRQAKENTSRTGLNAIALARQAALLLLTVHEYEIPDYPVSTDFYRQALALDLRGKRDYSDTVLAAMGGVSKMRFSQFKSLLRLSDEAMELADRHNIDERRLRPVLSLDPNVHAEIIRQIIDFKLTGKQVQELCEADDDSEGEYDNRDDIPAAAMRMAKVTRSNNIPSAHDLARALMKQTGDVDLARARLQATQKLLAEAERCLVEQDS